MVDFYNEHAKGNKDLTATLEAMELKGICVKTAFMALVNDEEHWKQDKLSNKAANEEEEFKSHRQINDALRLLNNPGAEEEPSRDFFTFFKESYRHFCWAENPKVVAEERPQAQLPDAELDKMI